ncbi:uncharacterized protein LOC143247447 isoform X2 [Tachypleus tridentatus]|uniref:uncharacterized protein LOC143247447 isoform X2 n=1 Tax=Tachypleus tridentatus TaxID=6853 RepID=UPI003FD43FE1
MYYAVHKGRTTGVFGSWEECERQVKGFSGAVFKKFDTQAEAQSFVITGTSKKNAQPPAYQMTKDSNQTQERAYSSDAENRLLREQLAGVTEELRVIKQQLQNIDNRGRRGRGRQRGGRQSWRNYQQDTYHQQRDTRL